MRVGSRTAMWVLPGLILGLQSCHFGPLPSVPDIRGTYIAQSATIEADKKRADEILATFKQAEHAVQQRDLDALMALYADNYLHHGFTKASLRFEWKQLFRDYDQFSPTHVLTRITVESGKNPPTAEVTCTGSLWAISIETKERVNIDSWFGEVHYLTYTNGTWRLRGHAWEVFLNPKDTRAMRPPHPFF